MKGRNFMSRREHLFDFLKTVVFLAPLLLIGPGASLPEITHSDYAKRDSSLYRDVFDQSVYYEGTQYIHLERLYRDLFGKSKRSLDVNVFDEVPNSTFFTNRHGKESMSLEDLKRGPVRGSIPDRETQWTITKGKFKGISPGFFVKSDKGQKYLLKFDPVDDLELATGAEVVTDRFLHAIGYNVPQYTIAYLKKEQLGIVPGTRFYDESGFKKELTPERLEEFLIYIPETADGHYRASASRILGGEILGPMRLQGRRKNDPGDSVNHEDRREIRGLQVFNAWLNNNDVRESNTLDVVEERDGRSEIRHYVIDFNSALGSTPRGPKPPMFGHEYMVDYEESFKAFLGLGFWKKPWQKRWDEAGQKSGAPSLGYFDNRYFNPGRYKTQLPYFSFKDLTRADGYWAAKIIMKFTNEDIDAIVSTGEYSDGETQKNLARTLIERRDLIGRFWFSQANPLDEFRLSSIGGAYEVRFEDLAVHYGFQPEGQSIYRFDVIGRKGKKGVRLAREEVHERNFRIHPEWLSEYSAIDLLIRTQRSGEREWSPFVRIEIESETGSPHLSGILHQD